MTETHKERHSNTEDENDSISIQAKIVFGLNINVIGNIHFGLNDQEVIYPVEGVVAFHDYNLKKQKFLRLRENIILKCIVISPNRKYMGVLEQFDSNQKIEYLYSVSIYDLITLKKRRTIDIEDNNLKNSDISIISFTSDSKAIIVLTKQPNEKLFLYLFDNEHTIIKGYPKLNTNKNCTIECLVCNPKNGRMIIVGGKKILRIMKEEEKGFLSNYGDIECNDYYITSLIWLSNDIVVAGTSSGIILFIENEKIRSQFNAIDSNIYDLSIAYEQSDESIEFLTNNDSNEIKEHENVLCMKSCGNDFVYAIFNSIYVYRMTSKLKFERSTILRIEFGSFPKELYQIMNIAINFSQNQIICTAKHAQIYIGDMFPDTESYKTIIQEFKPLGENLHTDEIIGIAMCAWRPIIMTASKDQTVRIWNYETETVELVKKYQVDIIMVEIDPMGILAVLGFWNQVRIMKIYVDDLIILKTYNFPDCRDVKFSSYGQFIAIAYRNLIAITSLCNFEIINILKGHFANVLSVSWSENDRFLASGGEDGAVYLWNIETGTRLQEYVSKGIQYTDVKLIQNDTIYALTNLGTFYELSNSKIKREIKPLTGLSSVSEMNSLSLLSMALSRSKQMLFISSNQGHILNIQLPFKSIDSGNITNYRYFTSAVTKMIITYDDMYLITASKAGTLAIWYIKNNYGKCAPIDQDLLKNTEILAPRIQLLERIETINNLEKRTKQIISEFRQLQEENEIMNKNEIDEITKYYEKIIDEYKMKLKQLNEEHEKELKRKNDEIEKLKMNHIENTKNIIKEYKKKIIDEQKNIIELKDNESKLRIEYDEKLKSLANCSQETIQKIENDFKKQIEEYRKIINDLMMELDEKKLEHKKYYEEIEIDNDRQMIELQMKYTEKLKNERNQIKKLTQENDIVKDKHDKMHNEWKKTFNEMELLKNQQEEYEKEIEEYKMKIKDIEENEIKILIQRCSDLENKLVDKDIIIAMRDKQIHVIKQIQDRNLESGKCIFDDNGGGGDYDGFVGGGGGDGIIGNLAAICLEDSKNLSSKFKTDTRKFRNASISGSISGGNKQNLLTMTMKNNVSIREEIISNDIVSGSGIIGDGTSYTKKFQKKYLKYDKNLKQQIADDTINNLKVENELMRQRSYLENKIEVFKNQREVDRKYFQSKIDKLMKDKSFLIKELTKVKELDEQYQMQNEN